MVRNAFAIRTSETSSPDEVFARYFAPEVLGVLPQEIFATSALVLRSSPGGGKTSLMRIFTPGPLLQVVHNHQRSPHDEIHRNLIAIGAVDAAGPRAFGVMIPCASGYAEIGAPLDDTAARALFRALINMRIVLRTLRALCTLNELEYPAGLHQIFCAYTPSLFDEGPIPREIDLTALRNWAETVESLCFASIDTVVAVKEAPRHTTFDAVHWLSQATFLPHGRRMAARPIIMFDDVHRLRPWQRAMLYQELLDHRTGTPVWLAERTFVLDPAELLTGAVPRRDYEEVRLEQAWYGNKSKQYVKFVTSIADRRVVQMRNDLESFGDHLADRLSDQPTQGVVAEHLEKIAADVRARAAGSALFDEWLASAERATGEPLEKAIEWARLGILISRERSTPQPSLELEPLPEEDLESRPASGLKQAAERFVCTDLHLPYFYGIERVVRLSSYNVEEFLQICTVLYEHIHAQRITRRSVGPVQVPARMQHDALKKLAEKRFAELPRLFALGPQAQRIVEGIGLMSRERTYEPNAPYAPGVTGIGLNTADKQMLVQAAHQGPEHPYFELASAISSCVAQNVFEVRENLKQDHKNWVVLYLNRIFCVKYDLVYHTGGWQRVSLRRLHDWMRGDHPRSGSRMTLV